MCGITGILAPEGRGAIGAMTAALVHRGPDGEGFYEDDMIALGHRRLSIVDIAGGQQPMTNETGSLQLVCNGEIYNSPALRRELEARGHRFKTHCDVEVILHLYEEHGRACVTRLRGMFAFALWDREARTLLLARDHLGQKPLYYVERDGMFLFASEVKAIFASGLVRPEIDLTGIWHYSSLRFMPDAYTLFRGVSKIPAATTLEWSAGRISTERYWELDFTQKLGASAGEIEEGLDALLFETVDQHLLSDVEVGSFLSGGIDSSTIAAMMGRLSKTPVPAFGIGVENESFNELPYARRAAEGQNVDFRERIVAADMLAMLPAMVHHMEEPADPFGVGVYLVSAFASESVKVVLGGDGGDENFAGYDRFAGQKIVDLYRLVPGFVREHVVAPLTSLIPESFGYKSLAQKVAWVNHMARFTDAERYVESMTYLRFTMDAKDELFTDKGKQSIADRRSLEKFLRYFEHGNADAFLDKMLYAELMTRIPDHSSVITDRMSMAHSLECRLPFLDHKLVEYAARIPAGLKLRGTDLKYILRRVAARYLPRDIVTREKQGFGFPIGIWMRNELRPFVEAVLRDSRFVEAGYFEPAFVDRIVSEHMAGKVDHSFRLWILINLEIWHRLYIEGETVENCRTEVARLAGGPVDAFEAASAAG